MSIKGNVANIVIVRTTTVSVRISAHSTVRRCTEKIALLWLHFLRCKPTAIQLGAHEQRHN